MTAGSSTIEQFLRLHGPSLSSDIRTNLRGAGLSDVAARQRVSRANGEIRRLGQLPFPHRERFLYLSDQWRSPELAKALLSALRQCNMPHGLALDSLLAHEGAVPRSRWNVISGSPIRLKRRISSEHVLDSLIEVGLLCVRNHPLSGEYVTFSQESGFLCVEPPILAAREHASSILLGGLKDWLRKTGLASWDKVVARDASNAARFGPFEWDVSGPSYVTPIARRSGKRMFQGAIVVDASPLGPLGIRGAESFLQKCRITRVFPKMPPFLAILLADGFDTDAFSLRSRQGALFVTPDTLFGAGISGALRELVRTLSNAAAAAIKNPDIVARLFDRLSAIEGAATNLRGPLFELLVIHAAHSGLAHFWWRR